MDKIQFWKKSEDDFSDLGLDDLNLDKTFGQELKPETGMPPAAGYPSQPETGAVGQGYPSPDMGMAGQGYPGMGGPAEEPSYQEQPSASPFAGMQGPGMETRQQPMQQPMQPYPSQQAFPSQPMNRDLELISVKLDSLRTSIDSVNQRLDMIERLIRGEHERRW